MIPSMSFNMLALAAAVLVSTATSFQLRPLPTSTSIRLSHTSSHPSSLLILHNEDPKKTYSDLEGFGDDESTSFVGEQFEGSVDWDAEWKKVVENRDQPAQRPGKYKSQVEIAAIKTTNKVAKNVYDASREMKESLPKPPSIRSLQGDWRFWIGIIVIVSFGLSIISATSQSQVNESFYI